MSNYKKREIFSKIVKYLEIPEIIVLHGARQVGKTTLMKMTVDYLKNKSPHFEKSCGDKEIDNVFYFDLEKEEYLNLCNQGYEKIINYIKARIKKKQNNNKKTFVFIDEIQYLDNPSSLLKLFYDHSKEEYKLIVSGSSSFAIKSKFKDSLVGRIIDLEIFGLSFKEFLDFKGLKYDLTVNSELAHEELKSIYKEYIVYGFYPQVVLTDNIELKEIYLNGIIEKYIYKDIRDLAGIKQIKKFNNLLKFLASQVGQLVNINELSDTLNISRPTIEEYLFILENTYIIKLIPPYYKNIRSELTKMPKIYFEDLGILNILRNKKISSEFDGNFFENAVYAYLRRKFNIRDINFWRTKSKQEIDFIIDNKRIVPIEVKLNYNDRLIKNLFYFSKKYHIDDLYCITYNKKETSLKSKKKNVKQLYPWEIEGI